MKPQLESIVQKLSGMQKRQALNDVMLIGISGPPGSGKSTLALELVEFLSTSCGIPAQLCPMDGYHLSNAQLANQGLWQRKGQIETFDACSMSQDILRLRSRSKPFFWPLYCRELHEPIAEGCKILPETQAFVVEGNYIFFEQENWKVIKDSLDWKIFIEAEQNLLASRLAERHIAGGKSKEEAERKVKDIDLPNAQLIAPFSQCADIVIDAAGQLHSKEDQPPSKSTFVQR